MRRIALILALGLAAPAAAEPLRYRLDGANSRVGFEADFGANLIRGQMPVAAADLLLDFDDAAASRVRVTLAPDRARSNLPFATEALKSDAVLATRSHPEISFASTAVRPTATGANVTGLITIRGVTREVTLAAQLYRPKGSRPGERDTLAVLLTGRLSRAAFGAAGFSNLVGDEVRLRILARIRRNG
ncbi:YceI family protein [Defluviimonas sp. WL0024]|uniref:YceI family protein n=2 Tax=Albidovulum TaxID=205889 RepID=A0ABT3J2D0_9RHOB|nr:MULTISPECIES: YceI family protein [Defluviimonas]MCU9847756.1 YceI family protein [Defluviimonas sp. WL0024]MCW3781815.1 YceI family protein [Defluviimonas salinarum]